MWPRLNRHDRHLLVAELRRQVAEARRIIRGCGRYRHSSRAEALRKLTRAQERLRMVGVKA